VLSKKMKRLLEGEGDKKLPILPVELIRLIYQQIHSPDDVFNWLTTSRSMYQVWCNSNSLNRRLRQAYNVAVLEGERLQRLCANREVQRALTNLRIDCIRLHHWILIVDMSRHLLASLQSFRDLVSDCDIMSGQPILSSSDNDNAAKTIRELLQKYNPGGDYTQVVEVSPRHLAACWKLSAYCEFQASCSVSFARAGKPLSHGSQLQMTDSVRLTLSRPK